MKFYDVLNFVTGGVVCVYDGVSVGFYDKEEVVKNGEYANCLIVSIKSNKDKTVFELCSQKPAIAKTDAQWATDYFEQTGKEPSFF